MDYDLISDLHTDANQDFSLDIVPSSKMVICNGDVNDDLLETMEFVGRLCSRYEIVLFNLGNHDIRLNWNGTIPEAYQFLHDHPLRQPGKRKGVMYPLMPDTAYKFEDTWFVGSIGWYDFKGAEPHMNAEGAYKLWQDHVNEAKSINWDGNRPDFYAEQEVHALCDVIDGLDGRVVVSTHTVPLLDLTWSSLDPDSHGFVGSVVNTGMKRVIDRHGKKIAAWNCGHTHYRFDKTIDGIRYVNNARGLVKSGQADSWKIQNINLDEDRWACFR